MSPESSPWLPVHLACTAGTTPSAGLPRLRTLGCLCSGREVLLLAWGARLVTLKGFRVVLTPSTLILLIAQPCLRLPPCTPRRPSLYKL